jgi:hypothetical protein
MGASAVSLSRIQVTLRGLPPASTGRGMGIAGQTLLHTTVTVASGRTVILGSTQPGGPDKALILVLRPEGRPD